MTSALNSVSIKTYLTLGVLAKMRAQNERTNVPNRHRAIVLRRMKRLKRCTAGDCIAEAHLDFSFFAARRGHIPNLPSLLTAVRQQISDYRISTFLWGEAGFTAQECDQLMPALTKRWSSTLFLVMTQKCPFSRKVMEMKIRSSLFSGISPRGRDACHLLCQRRLRAACVSTEAGSSLRRWRRRCLRVPRL